jgi:hypothetical protein
MGCQGDPYRGYIRQEPGVLPGAGQGNLCGGPTPDRRGRIKWDMEEKANRAVGTPGSGPGPSYFVPSKPTQRGQHKWHS